MESSPDSDQTLNQSPWGGDAVQAQIQPHVPQQQVIIINQKYKPELNLRVWSTVILLTGVILSFALPFIGLDIDLYDIYTISSMLCCSSLIIASLLDAVYLKGKSDWQVSNGIPNTGSAITLAVTIIFAVICIIIFITNISAILQLR